ncbi:glutathione S-transferase theta-1-like isoform X2 [Tamandua tetradactyla]|uniref:glutathione S-transferase theta-1-like isoform X2 n=1 Tax=Tamandua tetradactyla TaxID=48850 RepID=UPI004053DED8
MQPPGPGRVQGRPLTPPARSVAILLYLSRKYQTPEYWYPQDLQVRACVDEYLAWQHVAIQLAGNNVYLCKSLLPHFSGQPVETAQLERLLGKLTPGLQHLEQEVLVARPFLAAEQISLADLMAFTELMQPTAVGCDVFQGRPRLAAWRARVEAALGPELIQEAQKLVVQPRDPQEAQQDPQLVQKLVQLLRERLR